MSGRATIVQLIVFGALAAIGFGWIDESTFLLIAAGTVGYVLARVEDAVRSIASEVGERAG